MVKKAIWLLFIGIVVIIGVVLFNTFTARPWKTGTADSKLEPLPDSAAVHLSRAVQLQTIGLNDTAAIDTAAYKAFATFIDGAYPLIRAHLVKTIIKGFSFVFEWKGTDTTLAPFLFMAHYDVVPVEAAVNSKWAVAPFSGTITDTCVWGRGTVDDKGSLISILEATEALLRKGFLPRRSIYLCFGHDEETNGTGATAIADYLEQKQVHPELVLDEGGEIGEEDDVPRPVAAIAVGEKGYTSFTLKVEKEGGHSSRPAKETAIDILTAALHKLRSTTTPARLIPPTREYIYRTGVSSSSFFTKMVASNLWLFNSVAQNNLASSPGGFAMLHTTIVPTILQSGIKDNVIPSVASAVVNCRILPGDSIQSVKAYIQHVIADDRVTITQFSAWITNPSPATSTEGTAYKMVENAVYRLVPNVLPTPFIMIGATDSKSYRKISNGVINFWPQTDSKGFHGINERIPLIDLQRNINFAMILMQESPK